MKPALLKCLPVIAMTACGSVQAVICSVTATSIPPSTLYISGANTDRTGTISGTCTQQAGDSGGGERIYIGVDQGRPPAGRAMTRQNGIETLNYEIYHASFGPSGVWNEATGVASTTVANGGVFYRLAGNTNPQSFSFPYYFRIPVGQPTAPPGIYDDPAIAVKVRLSDSGGSASGVVLSQISFGVSATIEASCSFTSTPAPITMSYGSFQTTPSTGSSAFQLTCTNNTSYTLTIGPSSGGTLLGLAYSLALSAPSGTGTGSSQSFSVNGNVAAGQSGTCVNGSCSASQAHSITVGF